MKLLNHTLAPLLAALVLAGCATVPATDSATPVTAPAVFKESAQWTQAAPAETRDRGNWWRAFADPTLDELVERAGRQNTGIAEAAARLAQAQALLRNSQADRAPQLSAGAGANRQAGAGTPGGSTPTTVLNAQLRLSYEVDLSGRLARADDAAGLDAQARTALLQSTRLLVQADVAQTYLLLRALDAERVLVLETLDAYRNTLQLTQSRFRAGDVAELDVVRVQAELAATESEALALERRRTTLEHALAVLVGDAASNFSLPALAPADWRTVLPVIPAGVPSTVLTRRPDVAAAQNSLLAAQARVGVARAAWFPNLSLTGTGGFASADLGDVFKWSARAWGIGALLSLPLLDGGRREAGVLAASAQFDGAVAQYRGQVLSALQEVEDQLAALRLLDQQAQAQERAVASASRATTLSDARYRNGLVSQLDLLDARRSELRNRRNALEVRSAQYQSTVVLIRALGGGWETPPAQQDKLAAR